MTMPAVDAVDLQVRAGEFLTLLGPSGSGKSTLLGLIAGFTKPSGGRVVLDEQDVTDIPPHRRNIGMVFQNYALFPHLSALDNVAFGLRRRGVPRREAVHRARAALERVDLAGMAGRRPHELSGGQQQRVAVARAIVFEPRLVLMDEPFGALDRRLREDMQLEMMRLHKELGMTFIFVTHDQEEALSMSDRIAVMQDGRIAQIGSPAELYEHPQSRFVAGFLGDSNVFSGRTISSNELDSALGLLHVEAAAPEAECALLVRPEHARLTTSSHRSEGNSNSLPCTVEEIVYLGATRRVLVRFNNGQPGLVNAPATNQQTPHVGDRAYFEWEVKAGHLIRGEPVAATADAIEVG
jgi:putative spermidine/putrescine transport system ATP-binding protein